MVYGAKGLGAAVWTGGRGGGSTCGIAMEMECEACRALGGWFSADLVCRSQVSRDEQNSQEESMLQRLQLQYDKELAFIEEQHRCAAPHPPCGSSARPSSEPLSRCTCRAAG